MDTFFEIDIKEPFSVSQTSGELKPKSSIELIFTFQPKVILIN